MEKIKVKPAPDLQVRDPFTKQPLPADGAEVPASTYWLRRIKDGDVLVVSSDTKPQPQVKPAAARKE